MGSTAFAAALAQLAATRLPAKYSAIIGDVGMAVSLLLTIPVLLTHQPQLVFVAAALLGATFGLGFGGSLRHLSDVVPAGRRMLLVTAHRRENFGAPFREVCEAVRELADRHQDLHVVYPVHPNPNVSGPAHEILSGHERISLCAPLDYLPFVAAMKRAHLILTDSGGVQEEAPALGKPVLVMRRETERPEAVEAGVVRLVGPVRANIVAEASRLLGDDRAYAAMAKGVSPYGDGRAAARIVDILRRDLAR